jgi:hypothetical protein
MKYWSQNSTVGIMTVLIDSRKRFFPSPTRPKWLWCTCSFLFYVYFYFMWGGVKGLGYGGDHLLQSSDKAKNNWIYTPNPPICQWCERVKFVINFAYILYVSVTSGHFVPTSVTLSRNTLLSKLGEVVLPWINFWFSFFCVNRITWEKVTKAADCCISIW